MTDERRQFQRLALVQPLDAWFGDFSVRLIDVSATGAQIEHDEPLPDDARALLRFWWRGQELELMAETARRDEVRSGLRFTEENELLIELLAESAKEMLLALEANARGDREANVIGDETITSAWRQPATGFHSLDLQRGWLEERTLAPSRPAARRLHHRRGRARRPGAVALPDVRRRRQRSATIDADAGRVERGRGDVNGPPPQGERPAGCRRYRVRAR